MIRPTASNVSALSSIVANGHQAIHFVSSAPSKIPYGGFSPVRLQARCRSATFDDAPAPAYRRFQPPSGIHPLLLFGYFDLRPIRTCRMPIRALSPSDPWLPVRLCCPVGSSLTMATSAPLLAIRRFMNYPAGARAALASRRGSPICSARPFTPCRHPYPGGPSDCLRRYLHRRFCLRQISSGSTTTFYPTTPNQVGSVTGLQCSLHATAWNVVSPASARTFTAELSRTKVALGSGRL